MDNYRVGLSGRGDSEPTQHVTLDGEAPTFDEVILLGNAWLAPMLG